MEKEVLKNSNCTVSYDPERKEISGRDLTDRYNDPAFYSKSKRGIKPAWENVKAAFTSGTTMHDITNILHASAIRTHFWCMVD